MAEPQTAGRPIDFSVNDRMPAVSIGMPVYNGIKYVRQALESLLSQTFSDFVIVVSDNASNDGTSDILREYALRDPRIIYISQPTNIGAEANFKFVFHATKSKYFMWAAADDIRSPDFIERNIQFLEDNEEYLASTLQTKFKGRGFDEILMGDRSLDQDDFALRLISFFQSWHANGRFYSLFRRRAIDPWINDNWEFLGSDWSLVTGIASMGKLNRIDDGWVELGRDGISNSTNIIARYRKGLLGWMVPFHRLTAETWRLMQSAKPSQRLYVAWRLTNLNLRAFVAQFVLMLTRRM